MNDLILSTWIRFKEIPLILRFITAISPVGALMVIFSVIPLKAYGLYGRIVTYGEWWRSGAACIFILAGATLSAIGICILRRSQWAQKLILVFFVVLPDILILWELPRARREDIPGCIFSMILSSSLVVWYIFFKKSVRDYFACDIAAQQSGDVNKPHIL